MTKNIKISIIIVSIVAIWLLSGVILPSEETTNNNQIAQKSDIMSVNVETLYATEYNKVSTYNAVTKINKTVIASENEGVIEQITAKSGSHVKANDVIISLQKRDAKYRLDASKSALKSAEINYKAINKLAKRKLASEQEIYQAQQQLDNAQAIYSKTSIDYNNLDIKAPIDGIVQNFLVKKGDYVKKGQKITEIYHNNNLRIIAEVPYNTARKLSLGDEVSVILDAKKYDSQITRIATNANITTRNYIIEAKIANPPRSLSGSNAQIILTEEKTMGVQVPAKFLTLNKDGDIGIKHAKGDVVHFIKLQILNYGDDSVWLTNYPEKSIDIISLGAGYVKDGDKVIILH